MKTAYLWEEILTPDGLTDILENYAQKANNRQIWPRYHQLGVVRKLLSDAKENGAGRRYLVQHSAGSGKSNSIAWVARQLIGVEHEGSPAFDSIIVITDRRVLDRQINGTIRQFTQVASTVGHADRSGDLRRFITEGKKIIITTVQKFPFILDDIGNDHRDRRFAIIIDEAHSSQGGKAAGAVAQALGEGSMKTRRTTILSRTRSTGSSRAGGSCPTPPTWHSPPPPRTRPWNCSERRTRNRTGRSGTCPSTTTR